MGKKSDQQQQQQQQQQQLNATFSVTNLRPSKLLKWVISDDTFTSNSKNKKQTK